VGGIQTLGQSFLYEKIVRPSTPWRYVATARWRAVADAILPNLWRGGD
jgi:hypothetical protein